MYQKTLVLLKKKSEIITLMIASITFIFMIVSIESYFVPSVYDSFLFFVIFYRKAFVVGFILIKVFVICVLSLRITTKASCITIKFFIAINQYNKIYEEKQPIHSKN